MKKHLVIIFVLFIICIICGIWAFLSLKGNDKEVQSNTKVLNGVIYDASMNVINVKTSEGLIYNFSIMDVDKSNIDDLAIGNYVMIEYSGNLNNKNDVQKIAIKKIVVKENEKNKIPIAWNDTGIFSNYYDKAYEKLLTLSLEEKVGQLFLVRVPEQNQVSDIEKYHFGGYILFGRDTKDQTKESLSNTISDYQKASKIPMIIATDEEGGTVVRISSNPNLRSSKFPSPQEVFKNGGFKSIEDTTTEMSNLLSSLGINVNLAPIADVSTDSSDFIYDRAFGKDSKNTSIYIQTVISASKNKNVSYVLKHFPGYGNNKDTHTGISVDNRSLDSFEKNDFLPFEAGIKEGAESILVSHNIITNVDNNIPASLSLKMHNILRGDLNFSGIIMTDDLAMDAISKYFDGSPTVKSILAGNDMFIVSDYVTGYNDVMKAINDGTITEDILNHNVFRVLAWKYYKGLIK